MKHSKIVDQSERGASFVEVTVIVAMAIAIGVGTWVIISPKVGSGTSFFSLEGEGPRLAGVSRGPKIAVMNEDGIAELKPIAIVRNELDTMLTDMLRDFPNGELLAAALVFEPTGMVGGNCRGTVNTVVCIARDSTGAALPCLPGAGLTACSQKMLAMANANGCRKEVQARIASLADAAAPGDSTLVAPIFEVLAVAAVADPSTGGGGLPSTPAFTTPPTPTPTPTATLNPTSSPTSTIFPPTQTPTATATPSLSPTPSVSPSRSPTPTPTSETAEEPVETSPGEPQGEPSPSGTLASSAGVHTSGPF